MLGTRWTWAGIKTLIFEDGGVLRTPWGEGKWGVAKSVKDLPECTVEGKVCLFADFSSAAHHVTFELPERFKSVRVGDGEVVEGKRIWDGDGQ